MIRPNTKQFLEDYKKIKIGRKSIKTRVFMGEKRGQLSIYVIIGIIVLAGVLLLLYLKPSGELQEGITTSTSLPAQIQDLQANIQGCLEQVTKEGINLISIQGGYLELEQPFPSIIDPFSNSISSVPGGIPTAYWYYEQNNGIARTQQPTLKELQTALERYIDGHVGACIPYTTYKYQGYQFNTANPVSIVTIGKSNVQVTLTYPVTITYKEQIFNLNKQTITIPSALGTLYATAHQTYNYLEQSLILENKTIDFMIVYKEIPYSGVDFACQPKLWNQEEVYNNLKNIINSNLPYIKPAGGAHTVKEKYFVQQGLTVTKDINVDITYDTAWPLVMQIHGHENDQLLRGQPYTTENKMAGFLMPLFCLNQYNFVYTIKYPVIITITQGDERFQFAYEVIIDHNQPRQATLLPEEVITTTENSALCQADQQELTIYALSTDENNNYQPLPETTLKYQCAGNTCTLGTTGNDGTLTTTMAACENGIILAEKQGYQSGQSIISSTATGSISVGLEKIYKKTVTVNVNQNGALRELYDNEQVIIRFQHTTEPYSTSIIVPGITSLQLLPGTYSVTSYLLTTDDGGLTIPGKTLNNCVDVPKGGIGAFFGITEEQCEKQEIPPLTITDMITGGNDYTFTATNYDLNYYNQLTITLPYFGQPKTYEALSMVQEKIKKSPRIAPQ